MIQMNLKLVSEEGQTWIATRNVLTHISKEVDGGRKMGRRLKLEDRLIWSTLHQSREDVSQTDRSTSEHVCLCANATQAH